MNVDDFLEHYGTRGMRWGVRKAVKVSSDYKKTAAYRNRNPKELTNKQISSINNRINLEVSYRRLNPTKIQVGSAMVKSLVAGLTTAASVYALYNSPAGKAAIALGKRLVSRKA